MKIVCLSDTHGQFQHVQVPPGDVLLHAGDFTNSGLLDEIQQFGRELRQLPHRHKIVIAGNHDRVLESSPDVVAEFLDSAIQLQDRSVVLDGLRFYGSPWQREDATMAFYRPATTLAAAWNEIPSVVDVLITHVPPRGVGDVVGARGIVTRISHGLLRRPLDHHGSTEIRDAVEKVRPSLHVFGHHSMRLDPT